MSDISGEHAQKSSFHTASAAAECWLSTQNEIVRGIAHAMSNRVATLSANLYLLDESTVQQKVTAMNSELDRLEQLLHQLRQLPGDSAAAEPLLAADSARTAVALHMHHEGFRQHECEVDDSGSIAPVRAVPSALLHALLVALTAAATCARDGGNVQTVLRLRNHDDVVHFIATAETDTATSEAVRDDVARAAVGNERGTFFTEAETITWLLRETGGRGIANDRGCIVEIPTLAAFRRQNGA